MIIIKIDCKNGSRHCVQNRAVPTSSGGGSIHLVFTIFVNNSTSIELSQKSDHRRCFVNSHVCSNFVGFVFISLNNASDSIKTKGKSIHNNNLIFEMFRLFYDFVPMQAIFVFSEQSVFIYHHHRLLHNPGRRLFLLLLLLVFSSPFC